MRLTKNFTSTEGEVGLVAASDELRILSIQSSPCSRNIKQAKALKKLGHRVSLACQSVAANLYDTPYEVYHDVVQLPVLGNLQDFGKFFHQIADNYDIFHIHNEGDIFTMIAAGAVGGKIPVIHDTHDLVSLRGKQPYLAGFYERLAHICADGLVFVSDYQRKQAHGKYKNEHIPSLVLWTAVSEDYVPTERLPKLSEDDGEIHLVYEGLARTTGYRDYREIFTAIADSGINVHIHSVSIEKEYIALAAKSKYLHYYMYVPPKELMIQLTQYDAGLIPLAVDDSNRECANASLPNKLFEYMAAGLPVIARRLTTLTAFIEKQQCGMTYEEASEIIALKDNWTLPAIDMPPVTMESQIGRLVEFYRSLQERPTVLMEAVS